MRLKRLELAAFGPFTERCLDLSGGAPGGLHLVYGRNAAGKSTALRAISDLLFGIPAKTGDDHVHPYQALRIRAELEDSRGDSLLVQRLKRAKDSLRDAADAPLDELALARLLGGVDRAMFERVFGLDHGRLREAGDALLEGKGDVGESLFDAGAGGQSVRRVLERLEDEAERLFKARGKNARINELIERYKAARKRVGDAAQPPDAYVSQLKSLEQAKADRDGIKSKLGDVLREKIRKEQLQLALRSIARRTRLTEELAKLGAVPDLPATFSDRRAQAQAAHSEQAAQVGRIERELERLEARRAELQVPEQLLSVGDVVLGELRLALGRTHHARLDLPKRQAELAQRRGKVELVAQALGFEGAGALEAARSQPDEARVRRVLGELRVASERRRGAEKRVAEVELALSTLRQKLAGLPPAQASEALDAAAALWRSASGSLASHAAAQSERVELEVKVAAELSLLRPFAGQLDELVSLPVPELATVERFERAALELEQASLQAQADEQQLSARVFALEQELAAEARAGSVPTEQELSAARTDRDGRLQLLLDNPYEQELARYRAAVSGADHLADRLRREAARVAEHARRLGEREALTKQGLELDERRRKLASKAAELEGEWAKAWSAAGLTPLSPSEMRSWHSHRARACELHARQRVLGERQRELDALRASVLAALAAALGESARSLPLEVAAARCEQQLEALRKLEVARQSSLDHVVETEARLLALRGELAAEQRAEQQHEHALAQAVEKLGLGAGLAPDEIEARISALSELGRAREQVSDLEHRISGMQRDIAAFEAQVSSLVGLHAPDLREVPIDRAATTLLSRYDQARHHQAQLDKLVPELAERQRELGLHRALCDAAERDLRELMRAAGASDLGELLTVEARAQQSRELRSELHVLEGTLAEIAGPGGLTALLAEAEGLEAAALGARLEELEQFKSELEEQHAAVCDGITRMQLGLELFAKDDAAEAADEEQALAASLRHEVDRWAQARLAASLLRQEIERYREENQGPVLKRASELYGRLTRGAYRALRVGREERSIVAVRASDQEVGVEGLNDAARYHLYLALRLASLEGYLRHAEPLPLVLDDVLIDFDEEGSRAALGVLGELSERLQILLFTHHRHNVELAREAVPTGRLFVHEL